MTRNTYVKIAMMRNIKRLIPVLLLVGFIAPLFIFSMVIAEESDSSTPDNVTTTSLKERIQARKDALQLKLTTAEAARLKLRCKAAQGLISSLSGRIKGIETSRTAVYGNIVDHMTTLSGKLQAKSVDTTEFDGEVTTLKDKIATFKTDLATYKQDVSDLKDLDCTTDPTAFKTMLETARTDLGKVATDIKGIHDYIIDTIKPTLVKIHTDLDANSGSGSE